MSAVYQLQPGDVPAGYGSAMGIGGAAPGLGGLLNDGGAHWDDLAPVRTGPPRGHQVPYIGGGSPFASTSRVLMQPYHPLADHLDLTASPCPGPSISPALPFVGPRAFPPPLAFRDFDILKEVGDGSFGTVWLADWKSELQLPSGTLPPGPSSRPEYKGKKLVALKRMKKAFEGGWDECMKLKELKSLQQIPMHPNIIPLYDAFLLPTTKELYFVFECMEGNLYQLTKSRKGRPLASGLTASIFHQILAGLDHIHHFGYFHRDMKPENLLITTTGLADYPPSSLYALPGTPPEKDVVAVVKLADFGLAREIESSPPYTEYVSTRWYRAPEVLLRSRDYSAAVDMWALGTIIVEAVTLKPLFPGDSEIDQVFKICEVLGDPSDEYGNDERGRRRGGGPWSRGVKMAKDVGFTFPKMKPRAFSTLFDTSSVPPQLIECLAELLQYDPKARPTTKQCIQHAYFRDVVPLYRPYATPSPPSGSNRPSSVRSYSSSKLPPSSSRLAPASSHHVRSTPSRAPSFDPPTTFDMVDPSPNRSSSPGLYHLEGQYPSAPLPLPLHPSRDYPDSPMNGITRPPASPAPGSVWRSAPINSLSQWIDPRAQIQSIPAFGSKQLHRGGSPTSSLAPSTFYDGSVYEGVGASRPSSIMSFPIGYSHLDNASVRSVPVSTRARSPPPIVAVAPVPAASKRGWGFASVFSNNDKAPSPTPMPASVSVSNGSIGSQGSQSLKRSPSIVSMVQEPEGYRVAVDPKKAKKEAEKAAKTAEKEKRDAMQHAARERSRAVMRKKNQLMEKADALNSFPGVGGRSGQPGGTANGGGGGGSSRQMPQIVEDPSRARLMSDARSKSRRRGEDDDDGHSVSSNETGYSSHRPGKAYSIASVATSASDPERSRHLRHEFDNPDRAASLYSANSIRGLPHHAHRYPDQVPSRPPNTGHSSLDHQLITNMQELATTASGWESPARPESRLRPISPQANDTRYTPYPVRSNNLPPMINTFQEYTASVAQNGGYGRRHGLSTAASVQTYHSTPGVLPSHFQRQVPQEMETESTTPEN